MKMNKSIIAGLLGLSLAGIANAGTVYITGSTACRGNVYSALTTAGEVFTAAPTVTVYGGSSPSGSTYMAFQGTLVGGSGSTTVSCDWSGSEGGIADIAASRYQNFIASGLIDGNIHTNATSDILPASFDSAQPTVAFGDNSQAFSRSTSPVLKTNAPIGVITFKWVRNPGLWTGANVTDSQIRQALGGYCKRAVFSGNSADVNDFVYVSGRDNQSGTRVNAFGNSGFGIFTIPNQIEMNSAGVMQDLSGAGDYAGDYGFSSGGSLAGTLGANTTAADDLWNNVPGSGTGYSVIAYLSVGDAGTAIGKGATELTYNGIPFSAAAVKEGTYTFWGTEYIYQVNAGALYTAETGLVYKNLKNNVGAHADGTKLIALNAMHATRPGPTADPVH